MSESFYNWFMGLNELEVSRHFSKEFPKPGTVPDVDLALIASNLAIMDEGHLSISIILLGHHAPALLLPHLPRLLKDSRSGVWAAAERMILHLPKEIVTKDMLKDYLASISRRSSCPQDTWMQDRILERFG
jgi:hypothetical protein